MWHPDGMRRWGALGGGAVVALSALSGCADSAVDSACEVDALTAEAEHIVGEAQLTVSSVDAIACTGPWAVVDVTVAGTDDSTETFVFRKVGESWVLKAPEVACVEGGDRIPEPLAGEVCRNAA